MNVRSSTWPKISKNQMLKEGENFWTAKAATGKNLDGQLRRRNFSKPDQAKRIMIQAKAEIHRPKVMIGAVRFWRRVAVIVSLRFGCSGVFRL